MSTFTKISEVTTPAWDKDTAVTTPAWKRTPIVGDYKLLQETGDALLQEDGFYILLELSDTSGGWTKDSEVTTPSWTKNTKVTTPTWT